MSETQPAPAAPQIDVNAMAERLAAAAAQGTQQAIERVAARNQAQAAAAEQTRQTQADPVASTILSTVGPALRELAVKGDSGRDAAVFYATAGAGARRFAAQIEARHNELLARGIPVDRASLWNLIKGENGIDDNGETVDQAIKRRDAEVRRAAEAETVRGSRGGAPDPRAVDPYSQAPDELAKSLEGLPF